MEARGAALPGAISTPRVSTAHVLSCPRAVLGLSFGVLLCDILARWRMAAALLKLLLDEVGEQELERLMQRCLEARFWDKPEDFIA